MITTGWEIRYGMFREPEFKSCVEILSNPIQNSMVEKKMSPMFKSHRSVSILVTSLSSIILADVQQHMLEQFIFQLILQC